jgi:hypothetical protein
MKFGMLTVIKETDERLYSCTAWICKCDCGNEKLISTGYLTSGHAISCGCYRKNCQFKDNSGFIYVSRFYKKNAHDRGLIWELTDEQTDQLLQGNCFYCGKPPSRTSSNVRKDYIWNGIDRVDNSRGYRPENCVTCCKSCNSKKSGFTIDKMIQCLEFLGYEIKEPNVIRTDDLI